MADGKLIVFGTGTLKMRFVLLLLAGTLNAPAAHAETIYLCRSLFDLDSLFWSSAACVPSQASVVETLTVSTNSSWDETVFAAETAWAKKHGHAPVPRRPARPPSLMANGQCGVFQEAIADLDRQLSKPPSAPHMHDAMRLQRQDFNEHQLEKCRVAPSYSTAEKFQPVSIKTSGKSFPGIAPTDGPAVVFEFSASAGKQFRMEIFTSPSMLKGRWETGVVPGTYSARLTANLFYDGFPRMNNTQGSVAITNVTSEAIEGSWDLVLESGQRLSGPFKTAYEQRETGMSRGRPNANR